MIYIGLDAGSVSVKLVVLDENGSLLYHYYRRHKGRALAVALELLKTVTSNELCVTIDKSRNENRLPINHHPSRNDNFSLSLTGSAGRLIGAALGIEPVNEVVAFSYANRRLYPWIRAVIELGGEDSKLIILQEDSKAAKDFAMNSVCAAGTGSFLDQQAERLRISIEEFGELSLTSKNPPRIAGRCSVFAKSDMIHLQQIATPVHDIVAGLCFAVARNFKGSIARGREIPLPASFQGGVAANPGMIRAFREVLGLSDLFVPEEYALIGAIGAALKDMDACKHHPFDLLTLKTFISAERTAEKGHLPLIGKAENFFGRHAVESGGDVAPAARAKDQSPIVNHQARPLRAYLGIDIGSISTNLAVIDSSCRLLAKRYLMTAGRPIEAVRQGLQEIGEEIGSRIEVAGVGTTGSGRYMIADFVGADVVRNEITAQATAAAHIDGDVDTIFEIGGQDSKYISLRDGVVVDFEMNKACAAGTGSFLEEQAEKLGISVKNEFQEAAFQSRTPCRLGERCTVFMENSLMTNLQRGMEREDLLAGLAYSIVQNYINRVVGRRKIGERIFFQGGVAFNKSVVAAFERYLGREITVPPDHDVTGAIGMALIAKKHMEGKRAECISQNAKGATQEDKDADSEGCELVADRSSFVTAFKGFELSRRPYEISSFECKACPNVCEINRIKVEGEGGYLFYGGRCEKYDKQKRKINRELPDLFEFRDRMLWKAHLKYSEEQGAKSKESDEKDNRSNEQLAKGNKLETELYGRRQTTADRTQTSKLKTGNSKLRRIGIPYVFYFHDYLPYWATFLWELGFEVEVSPKTDRQIIDLGLESVLAETCFPVKTAHGHIKYLADRGVEAIFMPSFVNLNGQDETFERGVACPYTQTIPYSARVAFRQAKFLTPVIDLGRGTGFLKKELSCLFKPYGISTAAVSRAMKTARKAQDDFAGAIAAEGMRIFSALSEKAIIVVGRAYNSFDSGVNLNIPRKLAELGVLSIPMDFLPLRQPGVTEDWPNMYWRAGQRILSAARIIRANPMLNAIYIGNFSCGPDSFIIKYFDEEMSGKPYLHLEIDAHSADAGAVTRCEAFLDSINQKAGSQGSEINSRRKTTALRDSSRFAGPGPRTVFIPRMSDHAFALAGAFRYCGVDAEVLPESSRESVDLGKKFVSGKECYPCAVTTGDMVKKISEPGFNPARSAFFMPSGTGPCRFGQYNVFHNLVLKELGYDDIPIFAPNQDENFYEHLGIVGKHFTMRSWEGIVAIELLNKCLRETRPYEQEPGVSDRLYRDLLHRTYLSVSGSNGNIEDLLKRFKPEFEGIRNGSSPRPLIGIVGEIFVRSNVFSNEDLIRKVEALGGEAYLAPVEEWIYYVNYTGMRRVLIKRDLSGIISLLLKRFFQKRIEHKFEKHLAGFLRSLHEPDTRALLDKASPYIHSSFEGEAILSIGKSIDLIGKGVSGLINAMPFGCMPGTIVSGLMRGLATDFNIPCLSIPYDGTESLTTEIQLEAFMDQVKEYKRK